MYICLFNRHVTKKLYVSCLCVIWYPVHNLYLNNLFKFQEWVYLKYKITEISQL